MRKFGGKPISTINSAPTAGGTGYTVGDILTVTGGVSGTATVTVTTVSGGVVTGLSLTTNGNGSVYTTGTGKVTTGGTGVAKKTRTKRAEHLLSMFGLSHLGKRIPTELSGGQQQRVAIARALVNNPWILIADEPTGNLDSKSSQEVMGLLEELNSKSKRTVVLVTHNPDHLKFANRVVHLADGKIEKIEKKKAVHEVNVDDIGEVVL